MLISDLLGSVDESDAAPVLEEGEEVLIGELFFELEGGEGGPVDFTAPSNRFPYVSTDTYLKNFLKFAIPSEVPTRDGYEFLGWRTEMNDGKLYLPNELIEIRGMMFRDYDTSTPIAYLHAVWKSTVSTVLEFTSDPITDGQISYTP